MSDPRPDLTTLLDDVKTIKDILQNQDAPFPKIWRLTWTAAPAVALAGLLQEFVPFFRSLDFDGRMLWLWLPGVCLVAPLVFLVLYRELRVTGKRFLVQGRFQHLLFARFVIPPAALVLIWVSSRNTAVPMEGVTLLLIAIWQTAIEQALPRAFRIMPIVFLVLGLVELALGWAGPEVVLFNILLTAATIAWAGFLFRQDALNPKGGLGV